MRSFLKVMRPAVFFLIVMTVLCGVLYTGVITGIAQLLFPSQANGSMVTVTADGGAKQVYGSQLIEQTFSEPQYLIGRPMTVSNLSPDSAEQLQIVGQRVEWLRGMDPGNSTDIPADLVTASGSGVDPYISAAAAEYQAARIANARGMSEDQVLAIIEKYTEGRFLGFVGEPVVNVLMVNLALDGKI